MRRLRKSFIGLLMIVFLLGSVSLILADRNNITGEVTHPLGKELKLPDKAIKVSPNVYYLGKAKDRGMTVEGYAIIDFKKNKAKPGTSCGNNICEPGENANKCPADCGGSEEPTDSTCYGFLAKGAKWREVEPYMFDTTNHYFLDETQLRTTLANSIQRWETAANYNILGNEVAYTGDGADSTSPDGKNEVVFGTIEDEGAIAITIVWGIFGGAPKQRVLVEWDQIYDQTDFVWSLDGTAMDFDNIATHELGHTIGLDDLYTTECSQETMYGYASEGETNKRTLSTGDIIGAFELYN